MQNFMGKFNFGGDKPLFAGVIVFVLIVGFLLSRNNNVSNIGVEADSLAIDTIKIDSLVIDTIK